jgi:protein O-mannosyl-transferase
MAAALSFCMSKLSSPQPNSQPPARPASLSLRRLSAPGVLCVLLALATLAALWPVVNCGFLNYDDPSYFWDNDHVLGGLTASNLVWAFRSFEASNWHPLTWLSHMLDFELFGKSPGGPHFVNLALHVVNTVLLFLLLRRMTAAHRRSAIVAALFALHPLHVESVAWIAERKDVLSALFFMLTLWAYAYYAKAEGGRQKAEAGIQNPEVRALESASENTPRVSRLTFHALLFYALSLLFFAFGLMAKPMLVTLPFVLLLLDYWPLRRFERAAGKRSRSAIVGLCLEKAPFLLLSAASSVVTMAAQQTAITPIAVLPLAARIANALVSCARYLGKTVWPVGLALPYPHPGAWPLAEVLLAGGLVGALCLGAVLAARRLPFLVTGWFWFLGMLVPVIGVVQVGLQSMADRYTYLPLIGLFIILAWGGAELVARWRLPAGAVGTAAVAGLVACGLLARHQAGYWRSGERLFGHALAVTSDNYIALNLIGISMEKEKRLDEAIECYRESVRMKPTHADAQFNLGNALVARGQYGEAIAAFEATLRLVPWYYETRNNLANTLLRLGRSDEAIAQYQQALEHAPDSSRIHENLAAVMATHGKLDEAVRHYRQALALRPDNAGTHYALGLARALQGEWNQAIGEYTETLRLAPGNAEAQYNLGYALRVQKRPNEAREHLEHALRLKPDFPLAHYNLGCVLADAGSREDAVVHLREALRLKPDYSEAKQKLGELGLSRSE